MVNEGSTASDAVTNLTDDPLRRLPAEDRYSAGAVVQRLGLILDALQDKRSSMAIGLIGPWGSGKTTILNQLEANLEAADAWSVHRFDSWLPADAESLAAEFMATLLAALPTERGWKNVRESAKGLFIASAPWFGVIGSRSGRVADLLSARMKDGSSLRTRHIALAHSLERLPRPILIILDDVDRLQPRELMELLRALRVVGRLPRVSYLLAYDEGTVLQAVASSGLAHDDDRARDYMEKVVQVRVDLPPLAEGIARDSVSSVFQQLRDPAGNGPTLEEMNRFEFAWGMALRYLIRTPRQIGILSGQLSVTWPALAGDVDRADLVTLTSLRLLQPRLYQLLLEHRDALAGRSTPLLLMESAARGGERREKAHKDLAERLATVCPDQLTQGIKFLIDEMFPYLSKGAASARNRAGSAAYVDRYFFAMLPPDDVSDLVIAEAALAILIDDDTDEALREVERVLADPDRFRNVMYKLRALTAAGSADQQESVARWLLSARSLDHGAIPGDVSLDAVAWFSDAVRLWNPTSEQLQEVIRTTDDDSFVLLLRWTSIVRELEPDPRDGELLHVVAEEVAVRLQAVFQHPPPSEPPIPVRSALIELRAASTDLLTETFAVVGVGGWDALDVAARFVQRTTSNGRDWYAESFEQADFAALVGTEMVRAAQSIADGTTGDPDRSPDHANLRIVAAEALRSPPGART
jgi:hypothetical protein